MAQKNHYYVLVFTSEGPVFVTNILPNRFAEYDKLEKPMELSKSVATDVANGLTLNFNLAFVVTVPYELSGQGYVYETQHIVWEDNN